MKSLIVAFAILSIPVMAGADGAARFIVSPRSGDRAPLPFS